MTKHFVDTNAKVRTPVHLRRGRLTLAGGLALLLACAGLAHAEPSPAQNARRDATKMQQAFIAGDYAGLADYTYAGLVRAFGGRARMLAALKKALADMSKEGFKITSVDVGVPTQFVTAGKELHTVVPMKMVLSAPGGTLHGDGSLIGISADKGATWTFIDSAKMDEKLRKLILPNYNPDLRVPPKREPKFTPN